MSPFKNIERKTIEEQREEDKTGDENRKNYITALGKDKEFTSLDDILAAMQNLNEVIQEKTQS